MERLLTAALFATGVLLFGCPVASGQQLAPAAFGSHGPQRLPALDVRHQEILDRLSAAEAEIAQLRSEKLPSVAPTNFVEPPAPASTDDDWRAPFAELAKSLGDFKEKSEATKYPNVAINGVFQADAGVFSQDANSRATFASDPPGGQPALPGGVIENGADFRRARLSAKGAVAETMNYFFQMDFAFLGRPTFTDVWMEFTDFPVIGNVKVGQWKQPFSLEVVSSFRYTTFMERSLLFQAFTPFRHIGVGSYDTYDDESGTWALSYYRSGQDQFGGSVSTDGGNAVVGRMTYLPYFDEPSDGRYYLHVGGAYNYSAPPRDRHRFRTIPELFIGENGPGAVGTSGTPIPGPLNGTPAFVDTGALDVENYSLFGTELLWVDGPFSLQSEGMVAIVNQAAANPTVVLGGAYAQVGYFLTGEHRPYDRKQGCIDRIKPFENFFRVGTDRGVCQGWGAWEAAARWSYINLNDDNVQGGELNDATLGLNWYWNAYAKMQFNYIHAMLDNPVHGYSNTDIFAIRAQLDF